MRLHAEESDHRASLIGALAVELNDAPSHLVGETRDRGLILDFTVAQRPRPSKTITMRTSDSSTTPPA